MDPQIDRKTVDAGLIRVFHGIFAAVSDIFGNGFGTVVGGQGRIHEYPVFAVEFDNIVHPSGFSEVNADPGMIGFAGITDFQFRRNGLGAQQCGHQRGIVEADAFLFFQYRVNIRHIVGGCILGFIVVIGNIPDHIVIAVLHVVQIVGRLVG